MSAAFLMLPFSSGAQNSSTFFTLLSADSLISQLNSDRVANGLKPLTRNAELEKAAKLKAADMVANSYFNHNSPDNVNPWHWFDEAGYNYAYAGENLALDFADAESVQQAWMQSEKHRQNILNENYNEVGYAIAYGTFRNIDGQQRTRTGVVIVQMFGKQAPRQLEQSQRILIGDYPLLEKIAREVNNVSSSLMANTVRSEQVALAY